MADSDVKVLVSERELQKLREADRMLSCLQGAGVDNWEGYSDAMEAFNNGDG